jgi:flagellar basal-body rod protein FlgG
MSNMIAAQRAYEMNAKVISAADEMLQTTAGLFR